MWKKTIFKVVFRVPEVSQRLDIEITLQMAFGRARGDFSRPQSDRGIIVSIARICIFLRQSTQNRLFKKTALLKKFELFTLPERRATPWYIDSFQFQIFCKER